MALANNAESLCVSPHDYAGRLSVDLDQFHGLDQIGEEGLKDKVNNHYFKSLELQSPWESLQAQVKSPRAAAQSHQRFTSIHDRSRQPRFAIGNLGSRPIYPNSSNDHHPGRPSSEGLFHARHAPSGVRESHNSPVVLRRVYAANNMTWCFHFFGNSYLFLYWMSRATRRMSMHFRRNTTALERNFRKTVPQEYLKCPRH